MIRKISPDYFLKKEKKTMKEKLYRLAYKFQGMVLFVVEFKGVDELSLEELDEILLEQAAILSGEREGVQKQWL